MLEETSARKKIIKKRIEGGRGTGDEIRSAWRSRGIRWSRKTDVISGKKDELPAGKCVDKRRMQNKHLRKLARQWRNSCTED